MPCLTFHIMSRKIQSRNRKKAWQTTLSATSLEALMVKSFIQHAVCVDLVSCCCLALVLRRQMKEQLIPTNCTLRVTVIALKCITDHSFSSLASRFLEPYQAANPIKNSAERPGTSFRPPIYCCWLALFVDLNRSSIPDDCSSLWVNQLQQF